MKVKIGGGWVALDKRDGHDYGMVVYESAKCGHGRHVIHTLCDAVKCRIVRDVAKSRGHTQAQLIAALGVSRSAVETWWQGRQCPRGIYRQVAESYLLGKMAKLFPAPTATVPPAGARP